MTDFNASANSEKYRGVGKDIIIYFIELNFFHKKQNVSIIQIHLSIFQMVQYASKTYPLEESSLMFPVFVSG